MKRLIFLCLLLLTACVGQTDNPAAMVERYLQAKVSGDEATMRTLICADMVDDLSIEVASFATVEAEIQDMACAQDAGSNTVTCSGVIAITYGTEVREFPLGTYRVVEEDGEWHWCGEAG
ncbi:MAG: hypothetical protein HXY40_07000 [Chloroflexi bacterium]|nr:hypothetical protein [Chloroflexota bacterium]